jgi:ADP-ribose pyrophosphatase
MKTILFSLLLYTDFVAKAPKGDHTQGEIEIVTEPAEVKKIEQIQHDRLIKANRSEADATLYSRVGIVAQDQYWIWIRDAVVFPTGAKGTYNRLLWQGSIESPAGVAVLPVLPDGRIVLNYNFRHATRSWELELPRGAKKSNESVEDAALRELKEETGLETVSPTFLGSMAPDTGVLNSVIPVYLGRVVREGLSDQEYSEAIAGTIAFTKEELRSGLKDGFIVVKGNKVPLRDAFLTFALYQAEIRGLL